MTGRRILVVCPHPEHVAPSQRLKYEQYFEYLRANGYQLTVSPFMTKPFWDIVYKKGKLPQKVLWTMFGYARRVGDLARLPLYDGVYVHLWVTPFGSSLFERAFRLAARKIVYDIDDLVFLGRTSTANRIISRLKGGRSKYTYLMKAADHAVTCTPYLDTFVRQFNPATTDISSTINTEKYVARPARRGRLVLGWSGSFSTSPYLKLLERPLKALRERVDFKLLVIGDPHFKMDGIDVEAIAWKEASEVEDLSRIDIGLYPLPDEEWVLGKSGLKALQYMALGIPTVATAIGANFRVIEEGVSGYLVKTEAEWTARLETLLTDPALRTQMGEKARARVEGLFSIHANQDTYLKIFREVYGE